MSRYMRHPENHARRMFKERQEAGVVAEGVEFREWREKDISACVLSGDLECAFTPGKVTCISETDQQENMPVPIGLPSTCRRMTCQ